MKKDRKSIFRAGRVVLALLMALCLIGTDLAIPMADAAVTQAQIDALKKDANSLTQQKKDLEKEIKSLANNISNNRKKKELLDNQISVISSEITNTEQQIAAYAQLITETAGELAEAKNQEAEHYDLFCRRVRAMEEQGKVDYWSILFRATSFSDLLGRLDIINEIMEYDRGVIDGLKTLQNQTEEKKLELEDQQRSEEEARVNLVAKMAELDQQREAANALVRELQSNQADAKKELEAIDAEEEAIQAQIVKLSKELAAQQGPGTKGGYAWPTNSKRITSPFGPRNTGIAGASTNHKGIDIGGVFYSSEIKAAKAGTVIISQYSNSYGHYVVVSHGTGNTTLYAHMSSRKVKVGQKVSQGQVLGISGSTGISNGPHLHFEITENNVRVDPLKYLTNYTKAW